MSMLHSEPHPLRGKTVRLTLKAPLPDTDPNGVFRVEDWWDRVAGKSWMYADGNFAAMGYGIRSGVAGLPIDNEVIYGKVGFLGFIVHMSELGEIVS